MQMQHEIRSTCSRQERDSKRRGRKARKSSNSLSPGQRSPKRFGQIYSAPSLPSYGVVGPSERTNAAQYLQGTEKTTVADEPVQSKGQMLANHDQVSYRRGPSSSVVIGSVLCDSFQISHIESQHGRPTESSGYRVSAIGNTHHRLGESANHVSGREMLLIGLECDVPQVHNTPIEPAVVSDGARSWTEDTNRYRVPSSISAHAAYREIVLAVQG